MYLESICSFYLRSSSLSFVALFGHVPLEKSFPQYWLLDTSSFQFYQVTFLRSIANSSTTFISSFIKVFLRKSLFRVYLHLSIFFFKVFNIFRISCCRQEEQNFCLLIYSFLFWMNFLLFSSQVSQIFSL